MLKNDKQDSNLLRMRQNAELHNYRYLFSGLHSNVVKIIFSTVCKLLTQTVQYYCTVASYFNGPFLGLSNSLYKDLGYMSHNLTTRIKHDST